MQAISHRSQKSPSYTVSANKNEKRRRFWKSDDQISRWIELSANYIDFHTNRKYEVCEWKLNKRSQWKRRQMYNDDCVGEDEDEKDEEEMLSENLMLTKITTPISFVLTLQTMRRRSAIE